MHNLIVGLGLGGHLMVLAHLPAMALLVLLKRPSQIVEVRALALSVLALLPGLASYAYIPLRAPADPPVEYHIGVDRGRGLAIEDLSTASNFLDYVLRRKHHTHRWVKSPVDYFVIAGHHAGVVLRELLHGGALLVVLGAWWLWTAHRAVLAWLVVLAIVNVGLLAWHGAWWDIFLYPRYLTTTWVGVVFVFGLGLWRAIEWVRGRVSVPAVGALALVPALALLVANYHRCDRSDHYLAEDYAQALFDELPDGAQLLSAGDNALYPMMALSFIEGVRPDVQLVNPSQMRGDADALIASNPARVAELGGRPPRPAFSPDRSTASEMLGRQRIGLNYRLLLRGQPVPPLPPLVIPEIRGLDGTVYLDPISQSVAAQIEASIADALLVRGRRDEARQWIERVLRRVAPRTWGYFLAAEVMLAMDDSATARQLLELARRHGDSRAPENDQLETLIAGHEWRLEAVRLGDDPAALECWVKAAHLLSASRPDVVERAVAGLLQRGRDADAETRGQLLERAIQLLESALRKLPNHPRLRELHRRVMDFQQQQRQS